MKKQMMTQPEMAEGDINKTENEHSEYDIENAMKTLMNAEEIKANPTLHQKAMEKMKLKKGHIEAALGKKKSKIKSVQDIKAAAQMAED